MSAQPHAIDPADKNVRPTSFQPMTEPASNYSGKLLIAGIFLMALAGGLGSVIYRYIETREALALWGPEAAQAIAKPEKVEALLLEPTTAEPDLRGGDQLLKIVKTRDVTTARGFTNARNALVLDRSFDFAPAPCTPAWAYALRFTRKNQRTTILISLDCPRVLLHGTDRSAGIGPIVGGLRKLLEENLVDAKQGAKQGDSQ